MARTTADETIIVNFLCLIILQHKMAKYNIILFHRLFLSSIIWCELQKEINRVHVVEGVTQISRQYKRTERQQKHE